LVAGCCSYREELVNTHPWLCGWWGWPHCCLLTLHTSGRFVRQQLASATVGPVASLYRRTLTLFVVPNCLGRYHWPANSCLWTLSVVLVVPIVSRDTLRWRFLLLFSNVCVFINNFSCTVVSVFDYCSLPRVSFTIILLCVCVCSSDASVSVKKDFFHSCTLNIFRCLLPTWTGHSPTHPSAFAGKELNPLFWYFVLLLLI